MDPLMQFFTWQFMLFSLAVAGVTFVLRLSIEYFVKQAKELALWKNLLLPIFPLFLGSMMGWVMSKYPYPEGLVSAGSRIVFGMVAGMFSGLVYRAINSLLTKKVSDNSTTTSTTDVPQEVVDAVRDSITK